MSARHPTDLPFMKNIAVLFNSITEPQIRLQFLLERLEKGLHGL
jgi:hypothetical protein